MPVKSRWRRLAGGWLATVCAAAATAADPSVRAEPADTPTAFEKVYTIVITDAQQRAVKSLSATATAVPEGSFRPEAVVDLAKRQMTLRFHGITKPGSYRADWKLQTQLADGTSLPELAGSAEQAAGMPPKVDVSAKALAFAVARCAADCDASPWLAPEILKRSAQIQVKNLAPHPVEVAGMFQSGGLGPLGWGQAVSVKGDQGNTIPPLETRAFTVALAASAPGWTAGRYTGKARLAVRNPALQPFYGSADGQLALLNEAVHEVDVDIRVRDSVGVALWVALAGVIVGRLLQGMNTEAYRQRMALLVRLNTLQRGLRALGGDRRLTALGLRIAQQVDHIDQAALDPLTTEVATLERLCSEATRLWHMLVQVEALQPAPNGAADVVTQLNAALLNVVRNSDTTQVQAALDAATQWLAGLSGAHALRRVQVAPAGSPASPLMQAVTRGVNRAAESLLRLPAWLAGAEVPPVGLSVQVIQPLLALLLVALLALYGVWLVYAGDSEAAQTFGAQGVVAYVQLFLWGLTAQVLGKTLQNLSFSRTA